MSPFLFQNGSSDVAKQKLVAGIVGALMIFGGFGQPAPVIEKTHLSLVGIHAEPSSFCSGVVVAVVRVLTAEHCLGDGLRVGDRFARVVKKNQWLALLEVNEPLNLPIVRIAKSSPSLGDPLTTIGIVDLSGTRLTLRRSVASYVTHVPMMLIDGPLVPGMSGGPVINANGELVGINQASNGLTGMVNDLDSIKEFLK